MPEYRSVPVELIDQPELPSRIFFDQAGLDELAESLKTKGLLEPLLVMSDGDRFRLMAGQRRYLAAKMAYLENVPCMVYQPGEIEPEMVTLEENMCREDVTAAEQGIWILEIMESGKISLDQLCRKLKRSEAWVQDRVYLVQKDAVVAEAVGKREVTFSVAKELLREPDEKHRRYLLDQAIKHGFHAKSIAFMVDQHREDVERGFVVAQPAAGSSPAAPPPEALSPHCVFCGTKDAAQNMIQLLAHFYHWNPIKKALRDGGIEVYEHPKE